MNRLVCFLVLVTLLTFACPGVVAQGDRSTQPDSIYLLSGLTTNGLMWSFPADLYKFGLHNGQLLATVPIAAGSEFGGVDFIAPDYEGRVIVLGSPRYEASEFSVIAMDDPSFIRQVTLGSDYKGKTSVFHFLWNHPLATLCWPCQ